MLSTDELLTLLEPALATRSGWLREPYQTALRLFNGFYEGCPELVIDLYGRSLALFNYAGQPQDFEPVIREIMPWLLERLPWVKAALLKNRTAETSNADQVRRGVLLYGEGLDDRIVENGVTHALDLRLNQDASFYLDTRGLRGWLRANASEKSVLNTFAYTGSLGAAARAGGARLVTQTDRTPRFLDVAQRTWALNGWDASGQVLLSGDFFRVVSQFKTAGRLFDLVILDPPFFSSGESGIVGWGGQALKLINKVRPLAAHEGRLIIVNNALYQSGSAFMAVLAEVCSDGYLEVEEIIPAPEDVTGTEATRRTAPPADPAPFNHPTKIVVLRVKRKDRAAARD